MAGYYDMGALMPSESAYTNPGEYEAAQRSQAYEKATYMSNMDAFYEKLEEDARQFDLSLGFKEKELSESARQADLSSETQRYGYDTSAEASKYGSRLSYQASKFATEMQGELEGAKLQEQARQYNLGYGLAYDTLGENVRQFDVNTALSRSELDIANRMADIREQESQLDFYSELAGGADLLLGDDGVLEDIIGNLPGLWDTISGLWS
jgi:hypothetical protein